MMASQLIFYGLSFFMLATALLAVTARKIFRSAIWLLFSLTGIAGLYFWMQVHFIAAVQIAVYVGGIVVLIIFSIFLTQEAGKELPRPHKKRVVFSALAALFGTIFTFNLIRQYPFAPASRQPFVVSVNEIGTQLLSPDEHGYILPFEVVSILLLAAMVGCIVIAMKGKEGEPALSPDEKVHHPNQRSPTIITLPPHTEIFIAKEEKR